MQHWLRTATQDSFPAMSIESCHLSMEVQQGSTVNALPPYPQSTVLKGYLLCRILVDKWEEFLLPSSDAYGFPTEHLLGH